MIQEWPLLPLQSRLHCKICGHVAHAWDSCDVNTGGSPELPRRPESGQRLHYHRCSHCGFIFTAQLDGWLADDFRRHIYNDHYIEVDPDYVEARPRAQAEMMRSLLTGSAQHLTVLDYGSGSGKLAERLRETGIACDSFDPFSPSKPSTQSKHQHYDVVCAFEVLEHSPNPLSTLGYMRARLKEQGTLIVSTLLQPGDIETLRCRWWYCMPRNGHISLFSSSSLRLALQHVGAKSIQSPSAGLHIAHFAPNGASLTL
jgi:hypothetical protein